MNNENLNGTLALVHPGLANDPTKQQGQVGVITYVSKDSEQVFMNFPGGREAVYSPDAVLHLKDKNQVLETLVNEGDQMALADFKALYKITMLQDRGTSSGILSALEIARDNPAIWDKTLETAGRQQVAQLEKAYTR